MSYESLNKLNVWKEAKDFCVLIYKTILPKLPPEEKWGISQQLRRASQSISTNIAEGFGRYDFQDRVRFSYIARGSAEETISLIALCFDLGYIQEAEHQMLITKSTQLIQLINGYISYLKKSKQGEKEYSTIHENPPAYDEFGMDENDSQFSTLDFPENSIN